MYETIRNQDLATLARLLERQRTHAVDVVVPAQSLTAEGNLIRVQGIPDHMDEDGVTKVDGLYEATTVGDEGFSAKLSIPSQYLRRLHHEFIDLYEANLNGWLGRSEDRFLLRLLRSEEGFFDGVIRAVLSDRYRTIDNFDVLMATLRGVREAEANDVDVRADLTERRMYVRVTSPGIAAQAAHLLEGYRSPFNSGRNGRDYPLVWAGFVISNSEVGQGAFTIVPRLTWQVCTNGQTMTEDAMRKLHLGGQLDQGVVKPSARTLHKNLELISSQTADAVRTFLSESYVQSKLDDMARDAGVPIEKPAEVIQDVSKRLGFSKEMSDDILGHFIRGGQTTAAGVMQAVTATAQELDDGDAAYEAEASANQALKIAASLGRAG